jgi:adenosine/AMP kinase
MRRQDQVFICFWAARKINACRNFVEKTSEKFPIDQFSCRKSVPEVIKLRLLHLSK